MGSRVSRRLSGMALGLALFAGGCSIFTGQQPGGRATSIDQFTYVSTPYMPITVTLRDVRDGSELWSVDVPVHQKLVVRFYENKTRDNAQLPALMRWQLMDEDDVRSLANQMPVPGSPVRRLEMVLRDGPEFPSDSGGFVPASSRDGATAGAGAASRGGESVMPTPVTPRQPEDDWNDEEAAPETDGSMESPGTEPKMMIVEPSGGAAGGEPPAVRDAFEPTPYGEPAVSPSDTPEPEVPEPAISEPDA